MNIEDSVHLYKMIRYEFLSISPCAIGGYPSLIMQNVLKQSRDVGDIDLIISYGSPEVIMDLLVEKMNTFLVPEIMNIRIRMAESHPSNHNDIDMSNEEDGMINFAKEDVEIEKSLGVNKSTAIRLNIRNCYGEKIKPDQLECILQKIKNIDNNERPGYIKDLINTIRIILRNSDNGIPIDFFVMSINNVNRFFKNQDGMQLMHPYPILKAKHIYCSNKLTNDKSFTKHIQDLTESYDKIRIDGVNSPRDIDLLVKLRINEK